MDSFLQEHQEDYDDMFQDETNLISSKINFSDSTVSKPEPSQYRISTMTMITSFNCNINLEVVNRYFTMTRYIISMVYGDKPVKSSSMKKKTNRPFFNQATMIVQLDPLKKINVKIFSNGKVQMTGVKKEEDARKALQLILDKLLETEGAVPLSKLLLSQQIDFLKQKMGFETLPDYYYMFNTKPPRRTTWHKYNVTEEMKQQEKEKVILETRTHKENYGNTYLKDIDLNNLLLTKPREEIESIINIDRVLSDLIACYEMDAMVFVPAVEDKSRIQIQTLETVLINSDFVINFKIKRNILHSIIKDQYHIVSRYEPGIYPGVNNKYYWNTLTKGTPHEGRCMCEGNCSGKGSGQGDGQCKKITIAAFQSGSIIITVARNIQHIQDAYNFINRVITDNYDTVKKIETPFLDVDNSSRKVATKKYTKTTDIIYINKKSLLNKHNSPETIAKYKSITGLKL